MKLRTMNEALVTCLDTIQRWIFFPFVLFKTVLSLKLTFTVVFFYGINWTRVEEEEGEENSFVFEVNS
jgi:hypothetical protein